MIDTSMNAQAAQSGMLDAQADKLLKQAKTGASTSSHENAKITKAASDFESILLGTWLQQAENSFAKVPGGDGEEDGDSGKEQFQGIAMQALAGSITRSGGIGISKMISKHLHAAEDAPNAGPAAKGGPATSASKVAP